MDFRKFNSAILKLDANIEGTQYKHIKYQK